MSTQKPEGHDFRNKDSSTIPMGVECHLMSCPLPSNTELPLRESRAICHSHQTLCPRRGGTRPSGAPGSQLLCPAAVPIAQKSGNLVRPHPETNLPHQRKNGVRGNPLMNLHLPHSDPCTSLCTISVPMNKLRPLYPLAEPQSSPSWNGW